MRTQENLDALVSELQANCGDFYAACRFVGLSPAFVKRWSKDDAQVGEALDDACAVGALQLESAAVQRAVRGVEKGVYYKGELIDTQLEYSDSLLQLLMKKRLKNVYGDEAGPSVQVNIANIMPRASTYDEWLQMVKATDSSLKAIEDHTVDAEYEIVLSPPEHDPAMADIL